MALDVNSSLASLFSGDRASANRSAEKQPQKDAPAASSNDAFDRLVSRSNDPAAQSPKTSATGSRTRGAMPGRIAGFRDQSTNKPPSGDSTPATPNAPADAATLREEKTKSREMISDARNGGALVREDTTGSADQAADTTAAESRTAETQTAETQTAEEQAKGDTFGDNSASQEDASNDKRSDETASEDQGASTDQPTGEPVASRSPAVIVQVTGAPAAAAPQDQAGTGTASEGIAAIDAGKAKPATVSTPATGTLEATASQGSTEAGQSAADETLQPGMAKNVAEAKEALTKEALQNLANGNTQGTKASGDPAETAKAKLARILGQGATDGPSLRGGVFSEILEGFNAGNGMGRSNALLSGLDQNVAANALANRAPDVQRPTPLQMLPIEIGMQAVRGAREFQIRLDPAELGRVDVKLHVNEKGEVNATMMVERPETLQLLRRDANTLTQAFEQAGLKQGENGLSFSLKGDNQQGQQQSQNGRNPVADLDDPTLAAQISDIAMRRVMIPNSSLDRMV